MEIILKSLKKSSSKVERFRCISVSVRALRSKEKLSELLQTCLVFVFLQDWESFPLESFNSLVGSLGFVVKIVSLVQPASHLPGVQRQVDYPRHWDNLFLKGIGLLHVEGKTINEKAISPRHSLHHLLGEDVEDDLVRDEITALHHREELGASLAA